MSYTSPNKFMDDYESFDPFTTMNDTPAEEEKIYHELIGKYQGTVGETGTTTDNVIWESVNDALQILIDKGHSHYSRFLIQPTKLGARDFVNFGSYRAQLMSALQRMSQDFNLSDPSYLIHKDMPRSGPQIHTSAVASPMQYNSQNSNQNQTQNQETELTINQRVSLIEQELNENLTEEQLLIIKPALDDYKTEPTKWSKASKLIRSVLDLSKDVAIGVISNIISTQVGIPKA